MKTKLLFLSFLVTTSIALSQVAANQVDDFESGTVEDWIINASGYGNETFAPFNVSTGGPDGVDDNFLRYATSGNPGGPGSKMVIINQAGNWTGNYTSQGVIAIKMDVNVTENDLNLRVAFDGPGGTFCTTNAVAVTAGSGWQSVTFPISASDFTAVGGTDINATLAGVTVMRILSSNSPSWIGITIDSTLDLDNITASTTLSTQNLQVQNDFEISPNPATSKLNIKLAANINNATVTVYDVLGKKVISKNLSAMTSSIDVSRWNSGVYLVRVSTDNQTLTKRFVKQ